MDLSHRQCVVYPSLPQIAVCVRPQSAPHGNRFLPPASMNLQLGWDII